MFSLYYLDIYVVVPLQNNVLISFILLCFSVAQLEFWDSAKFVFLAKNF